MEPASTSTSWDRAQQLFNKNIELEKKRQKSLQARVPSDPNTWHQIRENYEAVILEDHAFSEHHNIEFFLWQLHYKRIEEFRAHFNTAQASIRSSATNSSKASLQPNRVAKIRVQFKAFLSEATGFYHDLILKIRAKHGLPLGHFSDDSDNMVITGNDGVKSSDVKKGLVSCHRCLIYLGDLVRYKGLYGEGESRAREYSASSSYYLQAVSLWPSNGNSHHQLAILANYASDEVVVIYRYFRSLAAEVPFPTAKDNLVIAFEKNRQIYTQRLATKKNNGKEEVSIKKKYKDFCNQFVRLQGILYSRTGLETISDVLLSVIEVLHELLSSGPEEQHNFGGDGMENELVIVRLAAILIFSVYNANKKTEGQTYAEILQHNAVYENACTVTFELMGLIVERCLQLHDRSSSFLLPGILIFMEWLACCPDVAACAIDEKKISASKMSFWKHCVALLNKLLASRIALVDEGGDETCFTNMSRYDEEETDNRLALGGDFELRGFLPLLPAQSILDFSRKHSPGIGGSNKERRTRLRRIIAAGKALTSVAMVDQKAVSFDSNIIQFIIGTQPQVPVNNSSNTYFTPSELPVTEQEFVMPSINSTMMPENAQLIFQGEDEDEEIVFKPMPVEKHIDEMALTRNSFEAPEKNSRNDPPLASVRFHQVSSQLNMPSSDSIPLQVHRPVKDLHNSTWLTEQQASQASVTDGIQKLRFENRHMPASIMNGSLGDNIAGSLFPPQTYMVGSVDPAIYSDYKSGPEVISSNNMNYAGFSEVGAEKFVVKPPTTSTFKSQGGRPVRHLGPPPGFSHVPPKSATMPVTSLGGTNNIMIADDYRWLDGFKMPSVTSSLGPSYATNQVTLGNNSVGSNISSLNGFSGLPFSGMHMPGVQFQGGSLNTNSEYQSFRNMHPSQGPKLPEQIMPGNQFNPQIEHHQGQPTWSGHYRV